MDTNGLQKENAINSAIANIKAGMLKKDVVAILSKMCPDLSKKTMTRYYAAALDRCQIYEAKLHKVIESNEIEVLGRASSSLGILSRLERQIILTDIARGNVTHTKEVATKFGIETLTVYPTWSDRKAAIQELNKMDSAYMPAEQPEIEEIKPIVFKIISSND